MNRAEHWNAVYTSKGDRDLSWFEAEPAVSLALLDAAGVTPDECIIDIGCGDSRLVDRLIERGFRCLALLDVSPAALDRAKARLGDNAAVPTWIGADVTGDWTVKPMDVWHDRAVFHFLTAPEDRTRYLAHLRQTVKPGGTVILATFALDGPERCSGLPVTRYSPDALAATLGDDFRLVEWRGHLHRTPRGGVQPFQYSRFARNRSG
jgi:SAM-dependent methyltransferase